MQIMVLIISLVLMAAIASAFVWAIRSSGEKLAAKSIERRRGALIAIMLAVGLVFTVMSLRPWPHAVSKTTDVYTVNVTGGQWYWEIDSAELPRGVPIVFNSHTKDVTHGFGVINDAGRLLFQVQVMPGYVNQVEYVFDEPGEYKVVCLEYCGLSHHDMIAGFTVVAGREGAEND